jgi:hypothetical protein
MAMEAMEEAFKSEKKNPFFKDAVDRWFEKGNENTQVKKYYDNGEYWTAWKISRNLGDVGKAPQNPKDMDIVGDIKEIDGEEDAPTKMVPINPESEDEVDTITMDVPLFIRALEYSREDAQSDLDLHDIAQNAIMLSKEYGMLNMDNYDEIFGSLENVEPQVEPQSPELNELESEDTPKQYTCNGPQRVKGDKILNYEPFKSLPDTGAEVESMGASLVSLPSLDTGGATRMIFSKEDLRDHSFEYNGKTYNTSGYIDEFKRKNQGEEPIFCDIQVNTDRNIPNAKIVNMPGMKSLDPRGQGPLDEKEIDEVSSTTGSLGQSSPINPIGYEPKKMETESKIYEALNALKKK